MLHSKFLSNGTRNYLRIILNGWHKDISEANPIPQEYTSKRLWKVKTIYVHRSLMQLSSLWAYLMKATVGLLSPSSYTPKNASYWAFVPPYLWNMLYVSYTACKLARRNYAWFGVNINYKSLRRLDSETNRSQALPYWVHIVFGHIRRKIILQPITV